MRNWQLEHHDGDQDGDDAVAERFHPPGRHLATVPTPDAAHRVPGQAVILLAGDIPADGSLSASTDFPREQ
jgi:hypothetical protein